MIIDATEFDRKVKTAMGLEILAAIYRNELEFLSILKEKTRERVNASPSVQSMYAGILRYHFGFIKGQENEYVEPVINAIIDSIKLTVRPASFVSNIATPLDITMIDVDYDQLANTGRSTYISINSKGEQHEVPWLTWLLTEGTQIVVYKFSMIKSLTPEQRDRSRSGQALMVHSDSKHYRVPPEHAGVDGDNFITKCFDDVLVAELGTLVETTLLRGMT